MTEPDDKTLAAYVDGELPPAEAAAVEMFLARSPEAAARAKHLRAMRARLSAAYGSILTEPVPGRLRALFDASVPEEAEIVDLAARRPKPDRPAWRAQHFGAMAASLTAGFVIAAALVAPRGDLVAGRGGALDASAALDEALERQAAATRGDIAIGVTFKDSAGAWCRTFAADNRAGLACRDDDRWSIRTLTTAPAETDAGAYRLAASLAAPEVLAAVDARIAGEPLDAEEEEEAIKSGWSD